MASPGAINADLARSFERAIAAAGIARDVVPARPKRSIFDWYFRRAGVDGMTDPFLLETLVVGSLLPFERPFIVAHEWSHLAGIADEGEANFTGWLACVRGSAASAYSGWLFLYGELARAIDRGPQALRLRGLAAGAARRSRGDSRSLRARREPARVRGRLARLRFVSESEPRRCRRGELRRGRASGARAAAGRPTG